MDTSETRIKMCERADEIQKLWKPQIGDFCVILSPPYRKLPAMVMGFITSVHDIAIKINDADVAISYKFATWLPHQDQLQEIYITFVPALENFPAVLSARFHSFANPMRRYRAVFKGFPDEYYEEGQRPETPSDIWLNEKECDYPTQFTSMEQLWLAFCMSEMYNKVWNGEILIKDASSTSPPSP